ncbi:MAG: rod shape-determining protein RodA [Spirosomataceae bacterium]
MDRRDDRLRQRIDWVCVILFAACVLIGWLNVYAAVYNPETQTSIFDLSTNAGKQLVWIGTTILLIIAILVIDYRFYETFAFIIYGVIVFLLVAVLVFGANIKGSHSWFKITETFRLQPAEFAKMATALVLARYISSPGVNLSKFRDQINVAFFVGLPAILILISNETGSTLVFAAFLIMLYREGLPGVYPLIVLIGAALFVCALVFDKVYVVIGLAVLSAAFYWFLPRYEHTRRNMITLGIVFLVMSSIAVGTDFVVEKVLQPHQRSRIKVLINPESDRRGSGWNVIQSKIAIGSGGFLGKGFLEGTQTKFDFVPEQSTDFIFCTIGEEHGFFGSLIVIGLLVGLMLRVVYLADRQRNRFARVYGYCVASIFFFHFMVNIGMTIGLMPVIGIPLPFFSYGGSSLWAFSILLFIFLKLDAHKSQMLSRV